VKKKMDMAFRLEFCFFVSRQRKNKKEGNSKNIKNIHDKHIDNQ
jgi:hypothetical protein